MCLYSGTKTVSKYVQTLSKRLQTASKIFFQDQKAFIFVHRMNGFLGICRADLAQVRSIPASVSVASTCFTALSMTKAASVYFDAPTP